MNDKRDPADGGGLLIGAGAALAMVLCCAGPALVAGGLLAGIGGLLRNPWVIGAGIAVLALAVLVTLTRHRRSRDTDDCCAPPARHTPTIHPPKDRYHR